VHTDGLMDSADAYFSRRETERKLEIMKDSRVGAFAVMVLVIVILLKIAFMSEILTSGNNIGVLLIFIPIISRTLQSSMLYYFPFAKEDGLANMYGGKIKKGFGFILLAVFVATCIGIFIIAGIKALIIPGIALLYYLFYYFSVKKNFGGITGDLLGAFLEVAEMLMIGALLFV
ncbi:MAG: adenosylcobinamide-GDP ribazoletransferase, partial [Clostridiales bacterium]|nr:adenosylcobinamide-GDP ribazoletransferase [Clostridiales bacterium]